MCYVFFVMVLIKTYQYRCCNAAAASYVGLIAGVLDPRERGNFGGISRPIVKYREYPA